MRNTLLDLARAALTPRCRCNDHRRADRLQQLLAERDDDVHILRLRLALAPFTVDLSGIDDALPIPAPRPAPQAEQRPGTRLQHQRLRRLDM